jgi:hypothetical protein
MLTDQEAQEIHTIARDISLVRDDTQNRAEYYGRVTQLLDKLDGVLQSHMEKTFLCLWDRDNEQTAFKGEGWFHSDLGYTENDIEEVRNLREGEMLDLSDGISQEHFVIRIN